MLKFHSGGDIVYKNIYIVFLPSNVFTVVMAVILKQNEKPEKSLIVKLSIKKRFFDIVNQL